MRCRVCRVENQQGRIMKTAGALIALVSVALLGCSQGDQTPKLVSVIPATATTTKSVNKSQAVPPKVADPDFRSIKWGMTRSQVEAIEGTPQFDLPSGVGFPANIAGMNAELIYSFANNQAALGGYTFQTKHENPQGYIDDYYALQELLTKKYGKPVKTHIDWSNDLYRDQPQQWGMAVIAGDLQFASDWTTPTTKIELWLR